MGIARQWLHEYIVLMASIEVCSFDILPESPKCTIGHLVGTGFVQDGD